ncbi:MAG: Gfo/Idh/MocA family protein [Spirochaetaceae bacterium]
MIGVGRDTKDRNQSVVRWGIIGCGAVTETKSGPGFQKVEGSSLQAVMRRDGAAARGYARRHGVPKWYDDADALIADPEVDAVYVATPPASHLEYAVRAAEAGKPVYVEKPPALNGDETHRMVQACRTAGVPLFVAYYRRALPRFLAVKSILDQGRIGTVRTVSTQLWRPPAKPGRDVTEIVGSAGALRFSSFDTSPVEVETPEGTERIALDNPEHVQQPLIQAIVDELRGVPGAQCPSTGDTALRTSRVMDTILRDYYDAVE